MGLANDGKYISQARPQSDACMAGCSIVLDAVMPGSPDALQPCTLAHRAAKPPGSLCLHHSTLVDGCAAVQDWRLCMCALHLGHGALLCCT